MHNKKIGTFDIETDALLENVTKVWCAVVKDHASGDVSVWDCNSNGSPIDILKQFDVLIGHNCIAFDFPVLRKLYGWEYEGTKIDTLLLSRTQRPNRRTPKHCDAWPHSVEAWAVRLGSNRKIQNEIWDYYHETILQRCKSDVEIQYKIYQALLEEGKGECWGKAHKLNNKLFDYLQRQEEYGWLIDINTLDRNLATLDRWIRRIDSVVNPYLPLIVERLEKKNLIGHLEGEDEYTYVKKPFKKDGTLSNTTRIYFDGIHSSAINGPYCRINIRPVELDSNKEVKEFLLKQGWQPEEWNEDTNGNRTSAKLSKDDPFNGIQGSLGRLIAKRVQCRHRIGQLTGWKDAIRQDGRISSAVGGVATTGRIRHRVVVNVPSPHSGAFFSKQMRQCFIAKPGWSLVGVDSKGNQIRQLAARMGDDEFTKWALKDKKIDGTDFHEYNQQLCGGISRSRAKNFFYGFIFGARAPKIAQQIQDSIKAAQGLIDLYLNRLPKLKQLIERITNEWRATAQKYYNKQSGKWIYSNGYITGLDGRPIQVDSEHKILCYMLQSDEAIQMAAAYIMFHKRMARAGYVLHKDWGMLIWMHDEWQYECRPAIAEVTAKIACECIKWAGEFYGIKCPHDGDYKIGNNWSETH